VIGKTLRKPLNKFSTEGILRYLISLPLNSIPIVGTVVFLIWNGVKAGPALHGRYFYLLALSPTSSPSANRDNLIATHRTVYTSMGSCSVALQMIPFVSIFLTFTSICGAALFAAELEDERTGKRSEEISVTAVDAVEDVKVGENDGVSVQNEQQEVSKKDL